jgi:hypothetical protein
MGRRQRSVRSHRLRELRAGEDEDQFCGGSEACVAASIVIKLNDEQRGWHRYCYGSTRWLWSQSHTSAVASRSASAHALHAPAGTRLLRVDPLLVRRRPRACGSASTATTKPASSLHCHDGGANELVNPSNHGVSRRARDRVPSAGLHCHEKVLVLAPASGEARRERCLTATPDV